MLASNAGDCNRRQGRLGGVKVNDPIPNPDSPSRAEGGSLERLEALPRSESRFKFLMQLSQSTAESEVVDAEVWFN